VDAHAQALTGCWGWCAALEPSRVEQACQQALAVEVVDVARIERMVERAAEAGASDPPPDPQPAGRFARDPGEFAAHRPARGNTAEELAG
jgi:hypothetical protein